MPDTPKKRQKGIEFYEEWMEGEGIPIYYNPVGVEDVTELPRRPWARLGGNGTFIRTEGTKEAESLLYVVEIPAGGSLEPEKHMYDELIYILRGRGLAEVWHEGQGKRTFEWGEGSLFAMPTNVLHRLVNGGREPVIFLARTNAPVVMNAFRNTDVIFHCDYKFTDRYTGQSDYFHADENKERLKEGVTSVWETNFVPDVRKTLLDPHEHKVEGGHLTFLRMATWGSLHIREWPQGKHHMAHYGNGSGAVLLILKSVGYALLWLRQYGIHPFQDGHGDKVMRMNWKPGSIYSSGVGAGDWFHAHYNTGPGPARMLALKGNQRSRGSVVGFESVRDGGNVIQYADEDPEIRRLFK